MLKEFLISLEWRKQSCNGFLQDIPLGRNIQNIRMAKNMTQMQVVEKCNYLGVPCPVVPMQISNLDAGI